MNAVIIEAFTASNAIEVINNEDYTSRLSDTMMSTYPMFSKRGSKGNKDLKDSSRSLCLPWKPYLGTGMVMLLM